MVDVQELLDLARCARINLVDNGNTLAGRIAGTAQIDELIAKLEDIQTEAGATEAVEGA